ncbi:protein tolkin-like [Cotesia typhae]|uniref:protein tolkin-like n=1 Tax=Cotesia typhae TaxID=2053667 RepID=UPI003D681D18
MSEKSVSSNNRTRRTVVILDKTMLWKGGIVPYEFAYHISGKQRRIIRKAMRKWEKSTCVQFVPINRQVHQKYLLFTKSKACKCCFIDHAPKILYQTINLVDRCYYKRILLHELGHALGFRHEHNHPERDQYVKVNFSIIEDDDVIQYQKYSPNQVDTLLVPYDLDSIMHYSQFISFDNLSINVTIPIPANHEELVSSNGLIKINEKLSNGDIAAANLMYHCPRCGKNFFKPTGKFEQFSNDSNSDSERCEWRIRASEGEKIILKINFLSIRPSYLCLLNYLEVRNGLSPDSPVIARYCGIITDAKVTADNFLVITYVKMSIFGPNFFTAEYETICEQTVYLYNDTIYNLESPNYPNSYMLNKKCQWNFTASENHQITIKFNFFALEKSENCTKDFVKITESDELTVLGVFCGLIDSLFAYSTDNKLQVEFSSDKTIEGSAFSASVTTIKK